YNQSGGTLNVTSNEYIGNSGQGTFNQSGGTHTAVNLYLGFNAAAATGLYSISNGATLSVANDFYVGFFGSGIFNQTGGIVTSSAGIMFGGFGGSGTANISGGTLTATTITLNNASIFNQTAGSVSISGTGAAQGLTIGTGGAVSSYNLSGGSLTSLGLFTYIGKTGPGSFTQ